MKRKLSVFLVSMVFVPTFLLSSFASTTIASVYFYKYCDLDVGSNTYCYNSGTGNDGLTYFKNTMKDVVYGYSSYKAKVSTTYWYPDVSRGQPQYKNYYIRDNYNSVTYTYSGHSGKYLNEQFIGTLSRKICRVCLKRSYSKHLYIKSGDPYDCASKPSECTTYVHASQYTY